MSVKYEPSSEQLSSEDGSTEKGFTDVAMKKGSSQGRDMALTGVCVPYGLDWLMRCGLDWLMC